MRTPGVEMVERLLVVDDITVLSVVEPAVVLAAVVCGNDSLLVVDITVLDGLGAIVVLLEAVSGDVTRLGVSFVILVTAAVLVDSLYATKCAPVTVEKVEGVSAVDVAVAVALMNGVNFVVIKLVAVPADNNVMVVSFVIFKLGVNFMVVVLTSGDVHGKDVVTLAAVKLETKVGEITADLLLVFDVPGSCSFFEVVLSLVDGDVALETVKEEMVMTGEVDFLVF